MLIQVYAVQAQRLPSIALWHEGVPYANPEGGAEIDSVYEQTGDHLISNVNDPSITPFLPAKENATGIALVIAPGGAHREIWIDHEGYNIAQRLVKSGIACFVLKYRLSRDEHSDYTLDHSVEDMQQAVRLVRSRATEWNIDPGKIGVIGFSAGGQVAALTDIQATSGNADADQPLKKFSSKPDFQALIYPAWTNNMSLTRQSSPAFIICGFHDMESISTGVPELYLKFKKLNIPAELHIYANAEHGFGIRQGDTGPSSKWPDTMVEWLHYINEISED